MLIWFLVGALLALTGYIWQRNAGIRGRLPKAGEAAPGFTLLADRDGSVAARYGSLRDFGVFRFARRNTFLVDPQGNVAKVYVGVNAGRNAQQVSDDLKALTSS